MSNYTYQHDPRISGADFEDDDDERGARHSETMVRIDCPFCKAGNSVHSTSDGYEAATTRVVCDSCRRETWAIWADNWKSLGFHARQMHVRLNRHVP